MSSASGEGWNARNVLEDAAQSSYGRFCMKFMLGWWRALRQGNPHTVLCFLLFIVALLSITQQLFFQDSKVFVNQHLIPAGSMCATQDDMFDDSTRRCQMGNRYAYAYLLQHAWVMCAPNMPGAKLLRQSQDSFGNFWYSPGHSKEVRKFYKTCIPTCAADDDTFHSSIGMCLLSNDVARVWLQGDGQQCDTGTPGAKAIRSASKEVGDGNFWYKPEMAARVEEFYSSCTSTCAKADSKLDRHHCSVDNPDAVAYLQGNRAVVCDDFSPGRSAITTCPAGMYQGLCDGQTYWYPRTKGERVEAWYTSCMRSGAHLSSLRQGPRQSADDGGGGGGGGGGADEDMVDKDNDDGGPDADAGSIDGGNDDSVDRDQDVDDGDIDKDAGADPEPDQDADQDAEGDRDPDADAEQAGGVDGAEDDDTPAMTLAPDGKLQFPYPQQASKDTATLCNFSGRKYWFAASDTTPSDWKEGVGHMYIPPMTHGSECTTVTTIVCASKPDSPRGSEDRHCGFAAPCDSQNRCDSRQALAVSGGINIINGQGSIEWLPAQGGSGSDEDR